MIKIYGLEENINKNREKFVEVIHSCMVDIFKLPADKMFYRFFPMKKEDFIFPSTKPSEYTRIEILIFEGRAIETKKSLIREIFVRVEEKMGISKDGLEITIIETPMCNWGIRGVPGDELSYNYKVEV